MSQFISYSHVDREVCDNLCSILQKLHLPFFRDEKSIDWGDSISASVKMGIEAADSLIVVVSPATLKSDWVLYEVGYASARGTKILPFLTHPSLELPHYIRDLKHIGSLDEFRRYFENAGRESRTSIKRTHPETSDSPAAFRRVRQLMPELMAEMRQDLVSDDSKLVREFVILPTERVVFSGTKARFRYYEDVHLDLQNQVDLLEEYGFVRDVTPSNTPIYRMTEEFVDLLLNENDF